MLRLSELEELEAEDEPVHDEDPDRDELLVELDSWARSRAVSDGMDEPGDRLSLEPEETQDESLPEEDDEVYEDPGECDGPLGVG